MMADRSFSVDVSYFQRTVNWLYSRVWFIFRCTFGAGFVDPNFAANFAWANKNVGRVRPFRRTLRGFTIYTVYLPGNDVVTAVKNAVEAAASRYGIAEPWKWVTVNVDVETWRGASYEIRGDHSDEIVGVLDGFVALIADKAGVPVAAAQRRVICYGNTGDLAVVFPRLRPAWLWWKIAKYSDTPPVWPQMIAWQYTDGSDNFPVPSHWPKRSAPFGRCDHDMFFLAADALRDHFYGTPDLMEVISNMDDAPATYAELLDDIEARLAKQNNLQFFRIRKMARNGLVAFKWAIWRGWFNKSNAPGLYAKPGSAPAKPAAKPAVRPSPAPKHQVRS